MLKRTWEEKEEKQQSNTTGRGCIWTREGTSWTHCQFTKRHNEKEEKRNEKQEKAKATIKHKERERGEGQSNDQT
jgi:hypothetical protein